MRQHRLDSVNTVEMSLKKCCSFLERHPQKSLTEVKHAKARSFSRSDVSKPYTSSVCLHLFSFNGISRLELEMKIPLIILSCSRIMSENSWTLTGSRVNYFWLFPCYQIIGFSKHSFIHIFPSRIDVQPWIHHVCLEWVRRCWASHQLEERLNLEHLMEQLFISTRAIKKRFSWNFLACYFRSLFCGWKNNFTSVCSRRNWIYCTLILLQQASIKLLCLKNFSFSQFQIKAFINQEFSICYSWKL